MIAKISGGENTAGLIRYLFGPGTANEHTDPHLVASWDGFAPDPGRTDHPTATRKHLVADLDLHVIQARRLGRAPERHVWHCSIRAAETDRHLSDDEWADIARRVVAATGIAPEGDPDGCRWVAVRHAPDHIHIAATRVRADLRTARHWNDYLTADRELAAIEKEHGLHQVVRGDRTAAKRPTRAESEKARRNGHTRTARERLRTAVRTAVAAATSTDEFLHLLQHTDGIRAETVHFPSGDVRGYKVAAEDTVTSTGEPVWFSGSQLAPDLSLPKIRHLLEDTGPDPAQPLRDPWHEVITATERIPHHLAQDDDPAAQAHITAFGEVLDILPLLAPSPLRHQLSEAATAYERATRSRIHAENHHARALRNAVRNVLRTPDPNADTTFAMLLDVACLVIIAVARWHQLRHHDQQAAAAHNALTHIQAAFDMAVAAPLATLGAWRPPQQSVDRIIRQLRQAVPAHAEQITEDQDFPALATVLAQVDAAGHDPEALLSQAVDQRPLDGARHPARVLLWRIQRITTMTAERAAHTTRTENAEERPTTRANRTVMAAVPKRAGTRHR
ncbi:relaxase/mobilization nuclease domain-containing protein [Streptomyces sp. NPDC088789]|uniref:relaxase/mobilization nuclease domain-containing protein n=1 Tax=Streptomyces sp. NPDC088789 TaxID=3365899 RepID=UPI00382681F3